MKNTAKSPYRSLGLEKAEAPSKNTKNAPKSSKISSGADLRAGGRK